MCRCYMLHVLLVEYLLQAISVFDGCMQCLQILDRICSLLLHVMIMLVGRSLLYMFLNVCYKL